MKTALLLPDSLIEEADLLARRLGISRTRVIQRALRVLRQRAEAGDVTAALNRVYRRRGRANRLDETLSRMQLASLPREDW